MNPDTRQQRAALRQSSVARKVRRVYGQEGTRVTSGAVEGTVQRHVPQTNAQGGYLVVLWDNGHTGRHSACSVSLVTQG